MKRRGERIRGKRRGNKEKERKPKIEREKEKIDEALEKKMKYRKRILEK